MASIDTSLPVNCPTRKHVNGTVADGNKALKWKGAMLLQANRHQRTARMCAGILY